MTEKKTHPITMVLAIVAIAAAVFVAIAIVTRLHEDREFDRNASPETCAARRLEAKARLSAARTEDETRYAQSWAERALWSCP